MIGHASKEMRAEGFALRNLRDNARQVKDELKDVISDDNPLDEHAPGATFRLVFLSYMLGLLLLLAVGLVYWLTF
jgi:hypothetical protein